ncbi:MAG: permease-like cell division protein FtsX [Neisseriaceae bacterium]|nr:permease-like cell division protein FtsX [Neisseriaceae bacterium]
MNSWLNLNISAAKNALRHLLKRPIGNFLILLMTGIALTLPLCLYLAVQSTQNLFGSLSSNPQITVYLQHNANANDIAQVKQTLESDQDLSNVKLIDKTAALQEIQSSLGDADIVSLLDENPLSDAFSVTPKSSNPDEIENIRKRLSGLPSVDNAALDAQWLQTLHDIKEFARQILWFLSITLGLAFVLVTHNTTRLQTLARKEEIEITRLLGAPASFVRRPFVYFALWQGLLSMVIGLILAGLIQATFAPKLTAMFAPYGINPEWRFFNAQELFLVLLIVGLLAIVGAWLAVRQHLKEYVSQG